MAGPDAAGVHEPAFESLTASVLPACALVGGLSRASELFSQRKPEEAWQATLEAIQARPFHPEGWLMLAAIAWAAGDAAGARQCAQYARSLAPGWKAAKGFPRGPSPESRPGASLTPGWLVLPEAIRLESRPQRLSVCLIAKNEEKFLARCLASIQGIADQVVLVDTGSTDRTVEIAREHRAEVFHFQWCDDFSAARNASLERARGDWVLVLDADEELAAGAGEKLRRHLADPAVMAWRLPMVDAGKEALGNLYLPRLFRNAPGVHFVKPIHEQAFPSIERLRQQWGLDNRLGEALLLHHGYTAEVVRDRRKGERNLRLLERAVEQDPEDAALLMQLGLEFKRADRLPEALARCEKAFAILSATPKACVPPELREMFLSQYSSYLRVDRQYDAVVRVLHSPLAADLGGLTASHHFTLGLAHRELGHFREAAGHMTQCLAQRGQATLSRVDQYILTAAPHNCLAVCLAQLGQPAEAERAFRAGLQHTERVDCLRLDFAQFLFAQNRPMEALELLNEAIAQPGEYNTAAWRLGGQIALSQPNFLEFACDWTAEAICHAPQDMILQRQRAEALLMNQDAGGARAHWETVWRAEQEPPALAALILCELAAEGICRSPAREARTTVSRAFLAWYRKLLVCGARELLTRLHERLDPLRAVLPEAAAAIEAALAEAGAPA